MLRSRQAKVFLSSLLVIGLVACSGSKANEGGTETGTTEPAKTDTTNNTTKPATGTETPGTDKPGNVPAAAFNIPELIGKMTWSSGFFNNQTGKVFTGFATGVPFKVLVDIGVFGDLPETVQLSEEQGEKLYTSPEYKAAAKAEVAKLSVEADAAFVSMKMLEEYEEGKVYELTTVKAGATTVKGKYAAKEMPLALQITAYTAAQVTAGKNRYNTAVAGATPSPTCASCHKVAKPASIPSPYYMSQYTDAAILSTIEAGLNTDDQYQTKAPHKMTFANATDKAGIVPYLRSLDPNLLPDQQQ